MRVSELLTETTCVNIFILFMEHKQHMEQRQCLEVASQAAAAIESGSNRYYRQRQHQGAAEYQQRLYSATRLGYMAPPING